MVKVSPCLIFYTLVRGSVTMRMTVVMETYDKLGIDLLCVGSYTNVFRKADDR